MSEERARRLKSLIVPLFGNARILFKCVPNITSLLDNPPVKALVRSSFWRYSLAICAVFTAYQKWQYFEVFRLKNNLTDFFLSFLSEVQFHQLMLLGNEKRCSRIIPIMSDYSWKSVSNYMMSIPDHLCVAFFSVIFGRTMFGTGGLNREWTLRIPRDFETIKVFDSWGPYSIQVATPNIIRPEVIEIKAWLRVVWTPRIIFALLCHEWSLNQR